MLEGKMYNGPESNLSTKLDPDHHDGTTNGIKGDMYLQLYASGDDECSSDEHECSSDEHECSSDEHECSSDYGTYECSSMCSARDIDNLSSNHVHCSYLK
eukprot:Lankesteria_metandrocarpae@DN3597_c0_g1_i2.p2